MIKTIKFDREAAMKEGLRKSTEIDKGYLKRPILRFLRKKTHPETRDAIKRIYNNIPSDIRYMGIYIDSYFNNDKKRLKDLDKVKSCGSNITLVEALNMKSFKKKSFLIYVEKQFNQIYSIRDLRSLIPFIAELNLGEFYDIAGKVIIINLSKSNNVYRVNKVVKLIND